ncbi:MAG: DUF4365 domain-containing protein [Ilumatobacteraceae bacterium]
MRLPWARHPNSGARAGCPPRLYTVGLVPKRPREHVLETASERQFAVLVPDEWVIEHPRTDYGVDLRVEIFAPIEGTTGFRTTGHEFGVQLKATDSEESDGFRVGVPWTTLDYWHSLAYPVLMVRYLAATQEFFARWVHERPNGVEDQPTVKAWFHFTDDDKLNGDDVRRLMDEVVAFENARRGRIQLPLRVRFDGMAASAVTEARWNEQLIEMLGPATLVLDRRLPSQLRVTLGKDDLSVDLGGGLAVYMHDIPTCSAADVVFAVGVCLGRCGSTSDATRCFRAAPTSKFLNTTMVFCHAIVWCMASDEVHLAIQLMDNFRGEVQALAMMLEFVVLRPERLDHYARGQVEQLHERVVESAPPGPELGRALFQRAKMLRSFNLHIEALMDLNEALQMCPDLDEDASYWMHRAGSEFLLERGADSVASYERSIELGLATRRMRGLHSDALLMAGRYGDVVRRYEQVDDLTPDEALHLLIAQRAVDRFAIDAQERDPAQAEELLAAAPAAITSEFVAEVAAHDVLTALSVNVVMIAHLDRLAAGLDVVLPTPLDVGDVLVALEVGPSSPERAAAALVMAATAGIPEAILVGFAASAKRRLGVNLRSDVLDALDAVRPLPEGFDDLVLGCISDSHPLLDAN